MSSSSTVELTVVSSVRRTSKSSGASRTGVPGPPRAMALNSVRLRSTAKASPCSKRFVSSVGSPPPPALGSGWPPRDSRRRRLKMSASARMPSLRAARGVSSSRPPSRSRYPASSRARVSSRSCSRSSCASSPASWRSRSASSRSSASGSRAPSSSCSMASYCCCRSMAASASTRPIGSSPENGYGSPKGWSGRSACNVPARRAMSQRRRSSRSRSSIICSSSDRICGLMLASSEAICDAWRCRWSISSIDVADARREVLPVPAHERVEVSARIGTGGVLLEERVEVPHHVAHPVQVLRREAGHALLQPLEEGLQQLLAQLIGELVEGVARAGIHELVVAQARGAARPGPAAARRAGLVAAARPAAGPARPSGPGPALRPAPRPVPRVPPPATRRSIPSRSCSTIPCTRSASSSSTPSRLLCSSSACRRSRSRSTILRSPGMSPPRVPRRPRCMRRCRARRTSPSASTSSASASSTSSASNGGSCWLPSQRE